MLGADTGSVPWLYLPTIGDEAPQRIDFFVVYLARPVYAERTDLTLWDIPSFFSFGAYSISHICSVV